MRGTFVYMHAEITAGFPLDRISMFFVLLIQNNLTWWLALTEAEWTHRKEHLCVCSGTAPHTHTHTHYAYYAITFNVLAQSGLATNFRHYTPRRRCPVRETHVQVLLLWFVLLEAVCGCRDTQSAIHTMAAGSVCKVSRRRIRRSLTLTVFVPVRLTVRVGGLTLVHDANVCFSAGLCLCFGRIDSGHRSTICTDLSRGD